MRPTDEQQAIIDAFSRGGSLVIEAGSGTGKSSALRLVGESTNKSGYYIAFNRAVADEARAKFPHNINCSTAHSLAFRAVGQNYQHRLNSARVTSKDVAESLKIKEWFKTGGKRKNISPWKTASLAINTVKRFCYSDDDTVQAHHVEFLPGVERMSELRQFVLPYARSIWDDVQKIDGVFRFEHDHYLKIWALSEPRLSGEFLMIDEAQDTNAVLAQIALAQEHMQLILVGDSRQQLFEWRGARDIMSTFDADEKLFLTLSFRFGPAIADEANRWLDYLKAPLRLRGLDSIDSELVERLEARSKSVV